LTLIFHITSRDAALVARHTAPAPLRGTGEYRAESVAREGMIHLSGIHQVLDVANRFYTGQHGLVILAVDASRLKAELKYEAPVHPAESPENEDFSRDKRLRDSDDPTDKPLAGDLFPHLYGPLNFDAVVAVYDFEPDSSGKFSLPAELISAP
jgi:uncharacterized protein (DUF952 family)